MCLNENLALLVFKKEFWNLSRSFCQPVFRSILDKLLLLKMIRVNDLTHLWHCVVAGDSREESPPRPDLDGHGGLDVAVLAGQEVDVGGRHGEGEQRRGFCQFRSHFDGCFLLQASMGLASLRGLYLGILAT